MTEDKSLEALTEKEQLNRIVPTNIQAEQMLLGAILINSELINQVSEFLRAEHFYEVLHQKIYTAIETILDKGLSATPITVRSMLDKDPMFIESEGNKYLLKLTTIAMAVINPYDYGKLVYELAIKRQLINIGHDIANQAYDSTLETSSASQIERAEASLYNLASQGINEKSFVSLKFSINESIESIDRAMKTSDHVAGISTGLIELDKKLSGFHNSDLIILAGRPSMGKTAFAINMAFNASKALMRSYNAEEDNNLPPSVGIFSLEMSSQQIASRLLSMMTGIDSTQLRNGDVSEAYYNELKKSGVTLSEMPIFIDDTPALSIAAIRTRARKLKRKHNLRILFIDYLQLIRPSTKSDNRVLEISEITQGLKAIAKELDIPVIALSQLSRAVEQRADNKPMLSDLRESGSIEQDSDVVMFIYRKEYYLSRQQPSPGTPEHDKWQEEIDKVHETAEILVAKHRNGAVGSVIVRYVDRYSRVNNADQKK